jgi:hypothetical protein
MMGTQKASKRLGRLLMLGLWLTVAGAWHAPAPRAPFHMARAAQPRLRPWRMSRGASDEPNGKPLPGEERLRYRPSVEVR